MVLPLPETLAVARSTVLPMTLRLNSSRREAIFGHVASVSIALGVVALVTGLGLLTHRVYNDETFYHALIDHYAVSSPLTPLLEHARHDISIGPFYFLAHRLWGGLATALETGGPNATAARAFSFCLMLTGSIFWNLIGLRLGYKNAWLRNIAFWVLPYHLQFSLCTLAESFMICFLMISLWLWIVAYDHFAAGRGITSALLFCSSGLALGIAENAKQPLLTISLSMVLFGVFRLKNRWATLGPAIAILIQIPFWISWGSMFPPGMRRAVMPQFADWNGLYPDTVIHLLTIAGLTLWPAVTLDFKSRRFQAVLVGGFLVWFFMAPDLNPENPLRFRFAGVLLQSGYISPWVRYFYLLPFIAGCLLVCSGVEDVLKNEIGVSRQMLLCVSLASVFLFIRSPLAFDRYAACFLATWYLANWPRMQSRPRATIVSILILVALAIGLVSRLGTV